MKLLPYIDEVVECPVCYGWGNFYIARGPYSMSMLIEPCTYCAGQRTIFRGEYRMREFQQLAQHG